MKRLVDYLSWTNAVHPHYWPAPVIFLVCLAIELPFFVLYMI